MSNQKGANITEERRAELFKGQDAIRQRKRGEEMVTPCINRLFKEEIIQMCNFLAFCVNVISTQPLCRPKMV